MKVVVNMDALTFRIYIWMDLIKLQVNEQLSIPEVTIDIPKVLNDPTIKGSLILRNMLITGLDTLKTGIDYIEGVKTDEEDNFDVCVKVPIQYLNLTTKYVADIGLKEEIPLYGSGSFSIYLSNISINTCMFASYKNSYVDKVDFQMAYRHGPTKISGVFKHPEANGFATKLLGIANVFFAMWNSYEPQKTSSFMSPLVQYAVNWHLNYDGRNMDFNRACFQNSSFDEVLGVSKELRKDLLSVLGPQAITTRNLLVGLNTKMADYLAFLDNFIKI